MNQGRGDGASFAAVDWGTSSFRLWLVGADGKAIAERRTDQGMATAGTPGFSQILEGHLAALGASPELPVLICGMAGAKQGWVEAGYLDCPTPLAGLAGKAVTVPAGRRDVRILPGLAQRNPLAADVMRGEETQLLGATLPQGSQTVVIMPGTHSKWVRLTGAVVEGFATFMTGELFAAIGQGTLLRHAVADAPDRFDEAAFVAAVQRAFAAPGLLTSLLFGIRGQGLLFGAAPGWSRETLSGYLIGSELNGGLAGLAGDSSIALVASGRMDRIYRMALDAIGRDFIAIDADAAVLNGLARAAASIWPEQGIQYRA